MFIEDEEDIGYPIAEVDDKPDRDRNDGNTEDEDEAVSELYEWWRLDHTHKQDVSDEFSDVYKQFRGKHWDMTGPDGELLRDSMQKAARPNSVENISLALIESLKNEFSQEPEIVDYPREATDQDIALKMTELKSFILFKNRIIDQLSKFLHNLLWYGTGIWQLRWDPNWRTGTGPNVVIGDIRWESIHPNIIYPDHRCGEDINDGVRVHKAVYRPIEYIRRNYPERGHLVKPDTMTRMDVLGVQEDDEGFDSGSDQRSTGGVALLIETWYTGTPKILGKGEKDEGDGLHVIWWASENQRVYLKHKNYQYYEPDEEPKFPFIMRQCYPRENSPWGFGEAYMLKNQQILLNKISEIIIESGMYQGIGQTFYEPGALTSKQKDNILENGSIPGMWFEVGSVDKINRLYGQGVPSTLVTEIQRRQRTMESIIGRHDITQGKTPGSVTAFRALNLLAQRAQVRLRLKEQAIKTGFEDAAQLANRLIVLFYDEPRKYRILGKRDEEAPSYNDFDPRQIRRVWMKKSPVMDVRAADQAVIPEGMVEGEDYETYSPELDTVCRVSQAMPTDRLFLMEMAKELLQGQLIKPSHFFHVLEYGVFPPWDTIAEEMEELFAAAAAREAQPQGAPAGEEAAQPELTAEDVQAAMQMMTEEQQRQFATLSEEDQMGLITALLAEAGGGGQGGAQGIPAGN